MAAANLGIIYATGSKVIRCVIVSDTDEELDAAIVPWAKSEKESVLLVPADECTSNATLREAVSKRIGQPTKSDRVVEVDAQGEVVAIWQGDPDIDRPKYTDTTMELHADALVGDRKVAGEFPTKSSLADTNEEIALKAAIGIEGATEMPAP